MSDPHLAIFDHPVSVLLPLCSRCSRHLLRSLWAIFLTPFLSLSSAFSVHCFWSKPWILILPPARVNILPPSLLPLKIVWAWSNMKLSFLFIFFLWQAISPDIDTLSHLIFSKRRCYAPVISRSNVFLFSLSMSSVLGRNMMLKCPSRYRIWIFEIFP